MFAESILLLLMFFGVIVVILFLHHTSSKALLSHIEEIRAGLVDVGTGSTFDITELKDELLDMVHDTIGNMQPPNAFDHIVGALSGPLQMWAMRKAGIDPATGQALQAVLPDLQDAFETQDS